MWRNLVIQALYQAAIIVSFQFKGVSQTIIFNSFVLCQVFNLVNAREVEKKNVFKGIHQNPLFWVSVGVFLALQMAFTETAHILVGVPRLNCVQWLVCVLVGMLSWATDWVTKCTSALWNCLIGLLGSHIAGTIRMIPSTALLLQISHPILRCHSPETEQDLNLVSIKT